MQKSDFTITKLKEAGGDETKRFECVLNYQGKPIAHVSNGGNGGCHNWYNLPLENAGITNENFWPEFKEFCAKECPEFDFEQDDSFVDELIEEISLAKWLKRSSKKSTCFRLKGDGKNDWRKVNAIGQPALDFLQKKFGDQIETIYKAA